MKVEKKRLASFFLAALMLLTSVLGHVEYIIAAEEEKVYTQVKDVSEITEGGNFVLVAENAGSYYAFDTYTSGKHVAKDVSVLGDELTSDTIPVWSISPTDAGVDLKIETNNYLAYGTSGTDFMSMDESYTWTVSESGSDTFRFLATTGSKRCIAFQISSLKFGSYSTGNSSGYVFDLLVFKETTMQVNEDTCGIVKSSVKAGEVPVGTSITLSCATEGATIQYNVDGTDNYKEYDGTPIILSEDTTIKAFASKDGLKDSEIVTFTYTVYVPKCESVVATPQSGTVEAGRAVVLSCATEGAKIYYSTDEDAEKETYRLYDGAITINEATTIYTYAKCDGYNDSDIVSYAYSIRNAETPLNDGDKIAIYNANSNQLLTNETSSNVLAGIAATELGDGRLQVESEKVAFLDVIYDEETGYYTFKSNDKYLTCGETGNSLSFADAESDYSLWQIYASNIEGKYLIKSVNATYLGAPQYIEYYKGFTTYGLSTTAEDKYALSFYGNDKIVVAEPIEAPVIMPTESEVSKDTVVTIENNIEGATIYYTLDGSDPLDASNTARAEYTSGTVIKVTDAMTVKAVTYKDGRYSEVVTKEYTVSSGNIPETNTGTSIDTLKDGNVIVIYNPSKGVLLSETESEYNGKPQFAGIEVTPADGKITLPEDAMLLTVSIAEDGTCSFISEDGKYLTSGATGNALTLEDSDGQYSLWELEKVEDGYRIKNKNAAFNSSPQLIRCVGAFYTFSYKEDSAAQYVMNFYKVKEGTPTIKVDSSYTGIVAQWGGAQRTDLGSDNSITYLYGDKYVADDHLDTNSILTAVVDNTNVSVYTAKSSSDNRYVGASKFGENDYIQLQTSSLGYGNLDLSFRFRITGASPAEYSVQYSTDGTTFYNFTNGSYSAKYTPYGGEETEYSGTITDGVMKFTSAVAEEGAYVSFQFDVPQNASNAETLYIRIVGGATKANGKTGSPSGTVRIDSIVLTGNPIISGDSTGYVVVTPGTGEVLMGQEITLTTATEGADIYYAFDGGSYQKYDAANKPVFTTLPTKLETYAIKDGKQSIVTLYSYSQAKCEMIKATPNGGAVAVGTKVTLRCNTEGATIQYAFDTGAEELTWNNYTEPFSLDNLPATVKVRAVKDGYLDSEIATLSFDKRENEKYNIYFGQLHAHTNYSDGAGSVEEAFQHATQVENLDFLAVTDHSNGFDEEANSVISQNMDTAPTNEWTMGHTLAEQYTSADFTCLYGYEMTWSNGLGHMNTFNTPGYQSRTQSAYTNYSTALQNYYAALATVPDSMSMFNHPGTTFGDFSDFSYWSELNDALITMIEVGNGEGAIGSSGYFPSYEYYTRALDKGWHVSPTNNQDNHKGLWGDANTARSVVLADKNTEEHIYDAMRNNRIYATEDNNLSIYYTLDGYIMGTVLEQDQVADTVELVVELSDADATDVIGKVEVIVNGGLRIVSKNVTSNKETVTFNVPTNYSYYYIKVTEADGDIAVTSPVWVGDVEACGINNTYTNSVLAVQGEPVDVNVDFYNNEDSDLVINSIEVKVENDVIHTSTVESLAAAGVATIVPEGTGTYSFEHTYDGVGSTIYEVTVKATLNGVEKIYVDKIEFSYTVPELVTKVIIDGSHYNDYVTGYYAGGMDEFIKICASKNIEAVIDTDGITAEDLEGCALLVVSAPAKKDGNPAKNEEYTVSHFEDEFIKVVKDYMADGGSVIVCGIADYQDTTNGQTATEQNKLLEAIGATIRMNSDEAYDTVNCGNQPYRLYPKNYNADSKWLAGVKEGQEYSAYSGCTVDITNAVENDSVYAATALVRGFDTTYSIDCKDAEGKSVSGQPVYVEAGKTVFIAAQETKAGGNIFVAGTVFISNFEVKAEKDNNDSLPYINYNIIDNILSDVEKELDASPISEARKGNLGDLFAVEGYVTAGTSNEYTTFFDTIYIQDETGGICVFPFSTTGLEIGTKMKVTGFIDQYQGDKEIQVISYEILDAEKKIYEPKEITTAQASDYDTFGGQLVKVTGTVTRIELTADGLGIAEYWVKDSSGVEAAVFIDGYILSGTNGTNTLASTVKVGDTVSGCGVLYKHPEGTSDVSVPVLRVRDCDEIIRIAEAAPGTPETPETPETPGTEKPSAPEVEETTNLPTIPNTPDENKKPVGDKEPSKEETSINGEVVIFVDGNVEEKFETILEAIKEVEIGQKVTIQVKNSDEDNVEVSVEVFTELEKNKEKDLDLVIKLSNGLSWTINSNDIDPEKWTDDMKAINFFAEMVENVVPDEVISSVVDNNQESFELSLMHKGEFGFTAALDIPVGEQYAGKEITLYYFNPATCALEKQDTEKVNEQGTIRFLFTHASDYVLVVESELEESPVIPDTEDVGSTDNTKPEVEEPGLPIVPIVVIVLLAAVVLCFVYAYKSGRIASKK